MEQDNHQLYIPAALSDLGLCDICEIAFDSQLKVDLKLKTSICKVSPMCFVFSL